MSSVLDLLIRITHFVSSSYDNCMTQSLEIQITLVSSKWHMNGTCIHSTGAGYDSDYLKHFHINILNFNITVSELDFFLFCYLILTSAWFELTSLIHCSNNFSINTNHLQTVDKGILLTYLFQYIFHIKLHFSFKIPGVIFCPIVI